MSQPLSRPGIKSRYTMWMRILGLAYLTACGLCIFLPGQVLYIVNFPPQVFNLLDVLPQQPKTPAEFWHVFAGGQMFTLAVLCLMSGQDPRNRALPLIHFVTKVVSASAFAFLFFEKEKYFAYALAFVVEVFIALFLLYWLARLALANRKELSDGQSLQAGAYPSESTQTDITESYSPSNDLASSTEMEPSSFSSSQDDPKRDDDGSGSEDPSKFQAKGIPH